jgi:hypothetical protein
VLAVLRCPDNNSDPNKTGWIYMKLTDQLLNLNWSQAPNKIQLSADMQVAEIGVHDDHTITLIGDADAIMYMKSQISSQPYADAYEGAREELRISEMRLKAAERQIASLKRECELQLETINRHCKFAP